MVQVDATRASMAHLRREVYDMPDFVGTLPSTD
jgi:hypothetical protein